MTTGLCAGLVAVEKWKEACGGGAALTNSEKRNTWRMAFQRAHEALVEAGYLKERDGYAWSRAEEIASSARARTHAQVRTLCTCAHSGPCPSNAHTQAQGSKTLCVCACRTTA